jgi:hypothetical protein
MRNKDMHTPEIKAFISSAQPHTLIHAVINRKYGNDAWEMKAGHTFWIKGEEAILEYWCQGYGYPGHLERRFYHEILTLEQAREIYAEKLQGNVLKSGYNLGNLK